MPIKFPFAVLCPGNKPQYITRIVLAQTVIFLLSIHFFIVHDFQYLGHKYAYFVPFKNNVQVFFLKSGISGSVGGMVTTAPAV